MTLNEYQQQLFYRFTLDSIGEIAFGYNIGSLKHGQVPLAVAFDQANCVADYRFMNPLWWICQFILPSEWEGRRSIRIINEFAQGVIDAKRRGECTSKSDILSRYMEMRDENGNEFSDKYLRDVVMNFIIAGRDTTAVAMSWSIYNLAKYPEIQEKVG